LSHRPSNASSCTYIEAPINPGPVDVGFVVDKMTLSPIFLPVIRISVVGIFPPTLYSRTFISLNLSTDSVVKQDTHTHTHLYTEASAYSKVMVTVRFGDSFLGLICTVTLRQINLIKL